MSVADHTALTSLALSPLFGQVIMRQFTQQRRIMVVPTVSLMAAMRAVDNIDELGRLLDNRVAVRWAELDAATAIRIGTTVPMADDHTEWPLVAPVVFTAQHLDMPVLTAKPELYRGYKVQIAPMP
ncbi:MULTISPECIES: hypothetical protein [Nocardia]|uniref:Uncharacterized protein n=1 Tax=Nocardia rhizosphaerihabitans TaxID=1691570 RepID=A0ABQ2KB61_9NOCA|nr:hypothetical protein [Nocardia rhizosphaerihabitans]GGN77152.1 hypothetical protein GCM10011610_23350 [Nocardia rhizosphaerihabitans]